MVFLDALSQHQLRYVLRSNNSHERTLKKMVDLALQGQLDAVASRQADLLKSLPSEDIMDTAFMKCPKPRTKEKSCTSTPGSVMYIKSDVLRHLTGQETQSLKQPVKATKPNTTSQKIPKNGDTRNVSKTGERDEELMIINHALLIKLLPLTRSSKKSLNSPKKSETKDSKELEKRAITTNF